MYLPDAILIIIASLLFGYYLHIYTLSERELRGSEAKLAQENKARVNLESEKNSLLKEIVLLHNQNTGLTQTLVEEKNRNDLFESQIQAIGSTVGTLDKLSKTDKELLQKYSKIYFLNENYIPSALTVINYKNVFDAEKVQLFHTKAYPFLVSLLDTANATNTPILVVSAYRSFTEQSAIKTSYKITYGSGANSFSADQGYSEHQLGTTLDFTTPNLGSSFAKFETTNQYKWLTENAWKYGFVLSYPKGNTYYQYEPWHWRFVGLELAEKLHISKQNFYDLPQREIDTFLVSIFD